MTYSPEHIQANQLSQEEVRDLIIMNQAFYAVMETGNLRSKFKTMPVLHGTDFHMWQFGRIKSSFLNRADFFKTQARKSKKDIYTVWAHQYVAESELEIDVLRDSVFFTTTMRMLRSQNFELLLLVLEKRTVRKAFECLSYGDADDATANPFASGDNNYTFIKNDGLNSENVKAAIASSDPKVVIQDVKQVPTVLSATDNDEGFLNLTTAKNATSALEITEEMVDVARFTKALLKMKSAVTKKYKTKFLKMHPEMFREIYVPSGIYNALVADKDLGNRDITSVNANLIDRYPDSLMIHSFIVTEADEIFAMYEQDDDDSEYHNIAVNHEESPNKYDKSVFGAAGNFPCVLTITPDALVHAEVMPINFRMFAEPRQLSVTYLFQESSDTLIVNAGQAAGFIAVPAA